MYTAIILTSDDCSYCQRFKLTGNYDTVHSSISKLSNIQSVLKVNLVSMSSPMPNTLPPFMSEFGKLFPSVILVKTSNWTLNTREVPPDTYGLNYTVINGRAFTSAGKDGDLTANNIIRWIKEKTNEDKNEENNNIVYHNNGSQYFCTSTDTGTRCVRKRTSRKKK